MRSTLVEGLPRITIFTTHCHINVLKNVSENGTTQGIFSLVYLTKMEIMQSKSNSTRVGLKQKCDHWLKDI